MTADERFALDMARFYRAKGLNPLPSSIDPPKKPMEAFTPLPGWENPLPPERFTDEAWEARPTTNLQVMLGRMPWRLLVIDLDGEEAANIWRSWCRGQWMPRTWITHREGGHSKHLWFRLPKDHPTPLPARFLWRGDGKHQGIERLCDKSLIVAPPSFHVEHKESRYRFFDAANSPAKLGLPAPCPDWILRLKPVVDETPKSRFVPPPPRPKSKIVLDREHPDHHELLDRIPDKIGLAREWNVKFVGNYPPARGWWPCYAVDREEDRPSAAVNIRTGRYVDKGVKRESLSLFDLMALSGHAHDWQDAMARLAERYR